MGIAPQIFISDKPREEYLKTWTKMSPPGKYCGAHFKGIVYGERIGALFECCCNSNSCYLCRERVLRELLKEWCDRLNALKTKYRGLETYQICVDDAGIHDYNNKKDVRRLREKLRYHLTNMGVQASLGIAHGQGCVNLSHPHQGYLVAIKGAWTLQNGEWVKKTEKTMKHKNGLTLIIKRANNKEAERFIDDITSHGEIRSRSWGGKFKETFLKTLSKPEPSYGKDEKGKIVRGMIARIKNGEIIERLCEATKVLRGWVVKKDEWIPWKYVASMPPIMFY